MDLGITTQKAIICALNKDFAKGRIKYLFEAGCRIIINNIVTKNVRITNGLNKNTFRIYPSKTSL